MQHTHDMLEVVANTEAAINSVNEMKTHYLKLLSDEKKLREELRAAKSKIEELTELNESLIDQGMDTGKSHPTETNKFILPNSTKCNNTSLRLV